MKRMMIAGITAAAVLGLATAAYAHRRPAPPAQDTKIECPSAKHWARCLWEEMDRAGSGG